VIGIFHVACQLRVCLWNKAAEGAFRVDGQGTDMPFLKIL